MSNKTPEDILGGASIGSSQNKSSGDDLDLSSTLTDMTDEESVHDYLDGGKEDESSFEDLENEFDQQFETVEPVKDIHLDLDGDLTDASEADNQREYSSMGEESPIDAASMVSDELLAEIDAESSSTASVGSSVFDDFMSDENQVRDDLDAELNFENETQSSTETPVLSEDDLDIREEDGEYSESNDKDFKEQALKLLRKHWMPIAMAIFSIAYLSVLFSDGQKAVSYSAVTADETIVWDEEIVDEEEPQNIITAPPVVEPASAPEPESQSNQYQEPVVTDEVEAVAFSETVAPQIVAAPQMPEVTLSETPVAMTSMVGEKETITLPPIEQSTLVAQLQSLEPVSGTLPPNPVVEDTQVPASQGAWMPQQGRGPDQSPITTVLNEDVERNAKAIQLVTKSMEKTNNAISRNHETVMSAIKSLNLSMETLHDKVTAETDRQNRINDNLENAIVKIEKQLKAMKKSSAKVVKAKKSKAKIKYKIVSTSGTKKIAHIVSNRTGDLIKFTVGKRLIGYGEITDIEDDYRVLTESGLVERK
jgi:hypothetical protein